MHLKLQDTLKLSIILIQGLIAKKFISTFWTQTADPSKDSCLYFPQISGQEEINTFM